MLERCHHLVGVMRGGRVRERQLLGVVGLLRRRIGGAPPLATGRAHDPRLLCAVGERLVEEGRGRRVEPVDAPPQLHVLPAGRFAAEVRAVGRTPHIATQRGRISARCTSIASAPPSADIRVTVCISAYA